MITIIIVFHDTYASTYVYVHTYNVGMLMGIRLFSLLYINLRKTRW